MGHAIGYLFHMLLNKSYSIECIYRKEFCEVFYRQKGIP